MREVILDLTMTAPPKVKAKRAGRERISYRELDVEQLGSVYEGLLEYEPKIAHEPMVVVPVGKLPQVLPIILARDIPDDAERFEVGDFYLAAWGGQRKGSGSYYTPRPLTSFLVEKALAPFVAGRSSEEILSIKVLYPAMGSGAFLVAACRYLTDRYMGALSSEREIALPDADDPADDPISDENREAERQRAMRLIAERCLYGVDLNPMAVELARVSLWLATLAGDRPLTFLDHHLRCGNSLIGARFVDLESPMPDAPLSKGARKANKKYAMGFRGFVEAFNVDETIARLLRHRAEESAETVTVEDAHRKADLLRDDESSVEYQAVKGALDLWSAAWFWPKHAEAGAPLDTTTFREILAWTESGEARGAHSQAELRAFAQTARAIAEEQRFFHWEIEFPEVYFAADGTRLPDTESGFSVTLGNPPWDVIEVREPEFFSNFDPIFRTYTKREANQRSAALIAGSTSVAESWDHYQSIIHGQITYFRKSDAYAAAGGDLNTFKLFLERSFHILRDQGRLGMLVPSGIYADKGCDDLRRLLFERGTLEAFYGFENRRKVFPIDSRFKFVALVAARGGETQRFPAAFMLHDIHDLDSIEKKALTLSVDLIRRFSPDTLAILEFRHPRDIEVAEKLYGAHPPLGEQWNAVGTFDSQASSTSLMMPR